MTQPAREKEKLASLSALLAEWPRELDSDFEVRGVVGRGGMAIVFAARDRARGRDVAIKVFQSRIPGDAQAMARVVREAAALKKLQHPNIVRLIDVRRLSQDNVAMVTQLVYGHTLKAELDNGPLDLARATRILHDIASALEYAHGKGVAHGDVKPENVLLHDMYGKAMLGDFGVARVRVAPPQLTSTGTTVGTPRYMAPEQFAGVIGDPRSDLYSLGIVAWEMLSGKRPWAGESLANVIHRQKLDLLPSLEVFRTDVPHELQELIEGLMAKRPDHRQRNSSGMVPMLAATHVVYALTPPPAADVAPSSPYLKPPPPVPSLQPARPAKAETKTEPANAETKAEAAAAVVESAQPIAPHLEPVAAGSQRRRFARRVPPPEHLPMGVKIGLTVAVIVGALIVTLGLPTRRGSSATVAGASAMNDSQSAGGNPASPAPRGGSVPGGSQSPARGTSPRSTLTSTGELTGDAGATAVPTGSRIPRPTDTAAAADSLFAQLAREDALIRSSSRVAFGEAAAARSGREAATDGDRPLRTVFPPASTRPLGPAIEFPRETATISAGLRHSCMLGTNGRALCWGNNQFGQLGDGTIAGHERPSPAAGGHTFARITAGNWHTCGLTGGGELLCWGRNEAGQLGDGTTIGRGTPARVNASVSFRAVHAGESHTCAIAFDDALRCWGSNSFGELGDGTKQSRATPVVVRLPGPVRSVTAGMRHTCALISDGSAYCWGRNNAGQLGNGTTADEAAPAAVAERVRFVSIAAGNAHTCAVASSGRAWCWGDNSSGQLGASAAVATSIRPQPLEVTTAFRSIAAGFAHTCARGRDNRVWCWGRNAAGQLGNGTTINQSRPVIVTGLEGIIALNATGSHTCGLSARGETYCWGENTDGQLGDGNRENAVLPVRVGAIR